MAIAGVRPAVAHSYGELPAVPMAASAQLVSCLRRPFSSVDTLPWREVRRDSIVLHRGAYCEVRGVLPAGHGRASTGGFSVRLRELASRKARETKVGDQDPAQVVTCDRAELPVLYKDE